MVNLSDEEPEQTFFFLTSERVPVLIRVAGSAVEKKKKEEKGE